MTSCEILYLTIISIARVGYEIVDSQRIEPRNAELAIAISHTTSESGITVLLKTPEEIPRNRLHSLRKRRVYGTPYITILVVNGI